MTWLEILFWCCLLILFYSYVGYGLIVAALVMLKRLFKPSRVSQLQVKDPPPIALIIAAWNEEDFIQHKIQNCLELDYPREKLELVFVTDGSTDQTVEIIRRFPQIILLHQDDRKGKAAAVNRAVPYCKAGILVFCDANTFLNKEALINISKHYTDPKVGGVAGEKRILQAGRPTAAASGEGLYWKYESILKKLDSDFYTTVGAAGELFSLRKELYEPAPQGTIIEDFVQSMQVCEKGFIVRYEPNAFAAESASASISEEMKRKVRISAGAFQAMVILKGLFNIFRFPLVSFQFVSHRILRWTICPLALAALLPINLAIVLTGAHKIYTFVLICQIVLYALSGIGWIYALKNRRVKLLYAPFYFLFINWAVFRGFWRFINKKQSALWEKANRQKLA